MGIGPGVGCFVLYLNHMSRSLVSTVTALLVVFAPLSVHATITAPLTRTSTGPVVTELQTALKKQGYYSATITAKYGAFTVEAVKAYQRVNRLAVTGLVDKNTAKALNTAIASTTLRRPTVSLTAIPNPVLQGRPVTLIWKSERATSCTGSSGIKTLSGSVKTQPVTKATVFSVTCTSKGGIFVAKATATVVNGSASPAPSLAQSATPPAPAKETGPFLTISASPNPVPLGETSTITWSSSETTSCSSYFSTHLSGTYTTTKLNAPVSYSMTCFGPKGNVTKSVAITLTAAQPSAPPPNPSATPTLTISASPNPVPSGSPTTLTWSSANATACSSSFSSQLSGTYTTPALTKATSYSMTCTGPKGTVTESVAVDITSAQAPINGVCGPAHGQSFASAPSANLCSAGAASSVTGSGPWSWTCAGVRGGTNANCSAQSGPAQPPPVQGADIKTPGAIGSFGINHASSGIESADTPISLAFLNDHAAGSRGQITSSGGHLYLAGQRYRLYGVNMTAGAALPAHADADRVAARLKKEGFNAVRLISFDRPVDPAPNPGTPVHVSYRQQGIMEADESTFNAVALDYFDYFVSTLEQNGIYIHLTLKNGRDIFPGYAECASDALNNCRGVNRYLPGIIAEEKDYYSRLLNHVNPYTGRAYKSDPGIAVMEYDNENSMSIVWAQGTFDTYASDPTLYPKYGKPLEDSWHTWLQTKYATTTALAAAWGTSISSFASVKMLRISDVAAANVARKQFQDWVEFMNSIEIAFKSDIKNYLRNTLGVRAIIYGTQNNYDGLLTRATDEASDVHQYFGDLGTQTGQTNPASRSPVFQIQNKSLLQAPPSPAELWRIAVPGTYEKEYGKPAFVTEAAYRSGNQYLAEFEPILAAYAGFNDLDGVYIFEYKSSNLYTTRTSYAPWYNSTANTITRPGAVLAFRRGDFTPGVPSLLKQVVSAFYAAMTDFTTDKTRWVPKPNNFHFGGDVRSTLTDNVYQQIVSDPAQAQIASGGDYAGSTYTTSSGEIAFTVFGNFSANASRTRTAVGSFSNTTVSLGNMVDVFVGSTMNNYAVLNLTSLTASDITSTSKMLYTVAGYYTVPGEWPRSPGQNTYSFGTDIPLAEAVPSRVRITTANNYKVTALDSTGARKADVPVVKGSGYVEFVTGPYYDTPWYLIEKI